MKYFICLIGLIVNGLLFSQDAPQVSKFTVESINGKAYLNWTIDAGGTCNGIRILRSTDSLIFQEVGLLEGVCGSLSFPTNYTYTDESPLVNKVNYYKLDRYRDWETDRKSTRLNSSHLKLSRMPSSA